MLPNEAQIEVCIIEGNEDLKNKTMTLTVKNNEIFFIGGLSSCNFSIKDELIEGKHAKLSISNGKIMIEDL